MGSRLGGATFPPTANRGQRCEERSAGAAREFCRANAFAPGRFLKLEPSDEEREERGALGDHAAVERVTGHAQIVAFDAEGHSQGTEGVDIISIWRAAGRESPLGAPIGNGDPLLLEHLGDGGLHVAAHPGEACSFRSTAVAIDRGLMGDARQEPQLDPVCIQEQSVRAKLSCAQRP